MSNTIIPERINNLLHTYTKDLDRQINVMQQYIKLRVELNDDHGCMDASVDLRELKAKRDVLKAFVHDVLHVEIYESNDK